MCPYLPCIVCKKSHGVMSKRSQIDGGIKEDRRRFSYKEAGQLWMSDVMHGPSVTGPNGHRKKKTYLIAFMDDATRVITHAQFAFAENTREFLPVFKVALQKRGLPQRIFVDNGANYRSHHFSIVCAKVGVALIHSKPFSPQSKGKIERFFPYSACTATHSIGQRGLLKPCGIESSSGSLGRGRVPS